MWAKILEILDTQMPTPTAYGWFHILFIVLSLGAGVLLCRLLPEARSARKVVLITATTVMVLEVYKIINYTFSYEGGVVTADFPWYIFPWQFCSTPMYVGLLAGLTRPGRVHRSLCAYLTTYALFAGVCVMVHPGDVFTGTVGVNVQTMVCHGSMLSVGMYLLGTGYVPATHRTILRALPVFSVAVAVAMALNEVAFRTGLLETDSFNMFYFSPHQDPHLPVFSAVQNWLGVDNPLCIVIYIAAFTLAGYLLLLIAMGVLRLIQRPAQKPTVTV